MDILIWHPLYIPIIRKMMGLTQKDIANELDISKMTLCNLEHNRTYSKPVLVAVSYVLEQYLKYWDASDELKQLMLQQRVDVKEI